LEQKIAHQEGDISLLKDMIKARDLTIERLQKELQELKSLREREKSSSSVVTELAQSIKSNVDSSFRTVQDTNEVDFNKLIIEVKKQLAMSFLSDFKETRIDKSTMSSKLGASFLNSPSINLDHNQVMTQDKTQQNLPNISAMNISGLPPSSIPGMPNTSIPMHPNTLLPNTNPSMLPAMVPTTTAYYPPYLVSPNYKYNPFYGYQPQTQPSAPFFPPGSDPNMKLN